MSQLNINTIKNKRGDYGPSLVGHSTVTGDLTVTGLITGDGSGLTGLGNTANIKSDTISNSGIITSTGFVGPLTGDVTGGVTGNLTGNVTGDVTGNLTGDVTGDVTGNLTGNVTGNITGTTGTFSGNVSVGGTLTYEDVTNVDSVGMVTARKGIQVLADGINAVGVVTATSFSGDGSNLSGIESGVANFVASGSITNGDTVVVNADGTVSTISGTGVVQPVVGSDTTIESVNTQYTAAVYDPDNSKVIVAYTGSNNWGTAAVGTVSGTSISFGTPVVYKTDTTANHVLTYDTANDKVIVGYRDAASGGKARVGTVSGTSISFGTEASIDTFTGEIALTYDSINSKVIIAYIDGSNFGKARVGTVSGTSISFGSDFGNAVTTNSVALTFDSNAGKAVWVYRVGSSSLQARVGTVSGTSISFGTAVTAKQSNTYNVTATFDSTNNKVVIVYSDATTGSYPKAQVGTVSGTSISFGLPVLISEYNSGSIDSYGLTYDSTLNRVLISYGQYDSNSGVNAGYYIDGRVSGTTIEFGVTKEFNSTNSIYQGLAYDPSNGKVVVTYRDGGNSNYGTATVITPTNLSSNLTDDNYIGIAAEAISSGATGKINIVGGINSGQTSLTAGKKYYIDPVDGSLEVNSVIPVGTTVPGIPDIVAGTAISATKIIVKG